MSPWLTVIGCGPDGPHGLPAAHKALLQGADHIVSSKRLLDLVDGHDGSHHVWPSPFSESIALLQSLKPRHTVVLATGDPMHFGIGVTLLRHFSIEEMTILPAPSAFSLAASRLGWALQETACISLHGRPVDCLRLAVHPGARILALTEGAETVRAVAGLLTGWGYGDSELAVLENMGGDNERVARFTAAEAEGRELADFNTLAISCAAQPVALMLPLVPGLPDEAFEHDGQLTKREVRAATLAALAPLPGQLLWDVGAGCGSVAIEWLRAAPRTSAIAFERKEDRLAMLARNAARLGVPQLEPVGGEVPETLAGYNGPDAVFLGGAVSDEELFETCWDALNAGGRLVANAVTLEGEAALIARQHRLGGDLVRMEISHLTQVGGKRALKPRMAVTQWRAVKG